MTKRKASVSLDEWLNDRRIVSEIQSPVTEFSSDPRLTTPPPTAEASQLQVAGEVTTESSKEVDTTEGKAAEWFWQLLAQAGFELW